MPKSWSRKRDDSLHALVRSMSQQERRYYARFAQQHAHTGGSIYLRIFQQLAQMAVYDEAALLSDLQDALPQAQFSALKYQLQAHVLRALRQYHQDGDVDTLLLNALQELAILYDKGLWRTFDRVLHRARRLGQQHERWAALLHLLDWERNSLLLSPSPAQDLQGLRAEEQRLTQMLDQENALKNLHTRIRLLAKLRGTPTASPHDDLGQVLHTLQEVAPEPPTAVVAAACYHNVLGIAALLESRHVDAFHHLDRVRHLWFSHASMIGLHRDLFRTSLTNFLNASLFLGKMEVYLEVEEALQRLHGISSSDRLQLDDLRHYNRLRYCLNRGLLAEGRQLLPAIEAWLQQNAQHLDPARVMHFLHNVQLLHFFGGDFKLALRQTRLLQQQGHSHLRADILEFSYLMELLLLFQTGDLQLLEYRLRAYQRRIRARRGQELGKLVAALMGKLLATSPPSLSPFQVAVSKLAEWEATDPRALPFGYWELRLWMESQASQLPIHEYFQQKMMP